jgi:hypothetical protein
MALKLIIYKYNEKILSIISEKFNTRVQKARLNNVLRYKNKAIKVIDM